MLKKRKKGSGSGYPSVVRIVCFTLVLLMILGGATYILWSLFGS